MEAMMSSSPDHNQSRVAQEALLTPVCDTGHSEVLRGRLLGTQPFDKGLGFSHQEGGITGMGPGQTEGTGVSPGPVQSEQRNVILGTVLTSINW